jgi:methionyl-tRNA formyltransferase
LYILFLGPKNPRQIELVNFLEQEGCNVVRTSKKIGTNDIDKFNFLISFGYRYIIGKNILNQFKNNAINLHISYLPWNRGADPNLWSIIDNTPKGVSIHLIDEGIDTGDIIAQIKVYFSDEDTLSSSYEKLQFQITELFKNKWPLIRDDKINPKRQKGNGTFHNSRDKDSLIMQLKDGWQTKLIDIKNRVFYENR